MAIPQKHQLLVIGRIEILVLTAFSYKYRYLIHIYIYIYIHVSMYRRTKATHEDFGGTIEHPNGMELVTGPPFLQKSFSIPTTEGL